MDDVVNLKLTWDQVNLEMSPVDTLTLIIHNERSLCFFHLHP